MASEKDSNIINTDGYDFDTKRKEYVYITMAREKYGRDKRKGEFIHHIDGNKKNDDPNNLLMIPKKEHDGIEIRIRNLTDLNLMYFFFIGVALGSLLIYKIFPGVISDIYYYIGIFLLVLTFILKGVARTSKGKKLLKDILFGCLKIEKKT